MAEFVIPDFLQKCSSDEFHAKMKEILPKDLDMSQGSHSWNYTYPASMVAAQICEFILPEVIRLIFPEWSYGEFLAGHGRGRGLTRRAATAATGELTITGAAKTTIPAGSLFSTAAINDEPSVEYATLEEVTIPDSGSVTAKIECTQAGIVGNTTENTIILVSSKLTGITAVTNEMEVSGGTEEESDESFIERILEYDKAQGESFIGNAADYKRWAKEAGAGDAAVLTPTDDSGLVTLIVTDANGDPATEALQEKVYNYIMRPDDPGVRKAPTNALLSVKAPALTYFSIKATVELVSDYAIDAVKADFQRKLSDYLSEALEEGEVKYSRVWAVLAAVDGVSDFKDLEMGAIAYFEETRLPIVYGTDNLLLSASEFPTVNLEDIILTSGTV